MKTYLDITFQSGIIARLPLTARQLATIDNAEKQTGEAAGDGKLELYYEAPREKSNIITEPTAEYLARSKRSPRKAKVDQDPDRDQAPEINDDDDGFTMAPDFDDELPE